MTILLHPTLIRLSPLYTCEFSPSRIGGGVGCGEILTLAMWQGDDEYRHFSPSLYRPHLA